LTDAEKSTTKKDTDKGKFDELWSSIADGFNDRGEYGDFTALNTTEAAKARTD